MSDAREHPKGRLNGRRQVDSCCSHAQELAGGASLRFIEAASRLGRVVALSPSVYGQRQLHLPPMIKRVDQLTSIPDDAVDGPSGAIGRAD